MKYNIWNAIAYEVTNLLIDFDSRWYNNYLVKLIRSHCFPDWVIWKTERTMERVDKQIEEIKEGWKQIDDEKYVKPIITEHEPDGSKAQELLGGMLQISAPWYKNGENTFTITRPPEDSGGQQK
jgi:hypothetical protein